MKQRNATVDYIRGIAILLVIIGHTVSNNGIVDYSGSGLYRVIFALQMPLFMLVSGYVTVYSKPIESAGMLGSFIGRRSLGYLLPWTVWTIFRGFAFGGWAIGNIKSKLLSLLWNMDSGYWFLFSLWTICIAWGISSFCANKLTAKKFLRVVFCTAFSMLLAMLLLLVGIKAGITFLNIKLTLYYIPYFFLGYIFASFSTDIRAKKYYKSIESIVVAASFVIFVCLSLRFNVATSGETVIEIATRIICSLTGCISLIYFASRFYEDFKTCSFAEKLNSVTVTAGKESLGLYLIHYLFLNVIRLPEGLSIYSFDAFAVSLLNFLITLLLSAAVIYIIDHNDKLKLILLGKRR